MREGKGSEGFSLGICKKVMGWRKSTNALAPVRPWPAPILLIPPRLLAFIALLPPFPTTLPPLSRNLPYVLPSSPHLPCPGRKLQ